MLYTHWQECDAWYGTFDEVAWRWVDDFGHFAAHSKVTAVEERFRVAAMELTPIPTGERRCPRLGERSIVESFETQLALLHRSTSGVGGAGWVQGVCVCFETLLGKSPSC